jgi:hypothetical protein
LRLLLALAGLAAAAMAALALVAAVAGSQWALLMWCQGRRFKRSL